MSPRFGTRLEAQHAGPLPLVVDRLGLPLVRTVENAELIKEREQQEKTREILALFGKLYDEWLSLDNERDRE